MATFIPGVLVIVAAVLLLWATPRSIEAISHQRTVRKVQEANFRLNQPSSPVQATTFLDQLNRASSDVATLVRPSVVHISAQEEFNPENPYQGISTGSGWIWDDQGHVLTNWHVVNGASRVEVQLHDGTVREATLVGRDPSTDIAVIRISGDRLVPATRASSHDEIQQGSLVFAFGSPLDFRFSMSQGIVSGLGRSVGLFRNPSSIGYENFIQVDAAINPGNSGGPLTNHRGEVVGMNTAIATTDVESEGRFSGIGLAIPLDMIESVAIQLIDGGVVRKGYLGIRVIDQETPIYNWIAQLGLNPGAGGVLVSGLGSSEKWATAGLTRGDYITHYDNQRILDEEAFVMALINDEDDQAELTLWRAYPDQEQIKQIMVTCQDPDDARESSMELLKVARSTNMSEYYEGIGFKGAGVQIVKTMRGTPARTSGLTPGDIIHAVNGRNVKTVDQLRSVISSMLPSSIVELSFWRPDPKAEQSHYQKVSIPLVELDTQIR
jgi:S1-C subfamily serine protease